MANLPPICGRIIQVHTIPQGEKGGGQGDPLMPLLFCLGQHPALTAVTAALKEGEHFSHIWTICLSSVHRRGSGMCTISS